MRFRLLEGALCRFGILASSTREGDPIILTGFRNPKGNEVMLAQRNAKAALVFAYPQRLVAPATPIRSLKPSA